MVKASFFILPILSLVWSASAAPVAEEARDSNLQKKEASNFRREARVDAALFPSEEKREEARVDATSFGNLQKRIVAPTRIDAGSFANLQKKAEARVDATTFGNLQKKGVENVRADAGSFGAAL